MMARSGIHPAQLPGDLLAELLAGGGEPAAPFKRDHIFYDILAYCSEAEPAAGQLDMMYRHSLIRKLVASVRGRETAQIAHWRAALDGATWQPQSATARAGIAALYQPAVALQAYYEDRYEEALAGLERGLDALGELHAGGFAVALVGAADQLLNLLRAHAAYRRADAALHSAIELLDLLYGAGPSARYPHGSLEQALEPAALASCANHYADEVMFKILGSGDAQLIARLAAAVASRCGAWRDSPVREAFLLLAALQSGAPMVPGPLPGASPDQAGDQPPALQLAPLPSTLQLLLLTALLDQAGGPHGPLGAAVQARLEGTRRACTVRASAAHWLQALAAPPPAMLAA
jgi:hypothetical protein